MKDLEKRLEKLEKKLKKRIRKLEAEVASISTRFEGMSTAVAQHEMKVQVGHSFDIANIPEQLQGVVAALDRLKDELPEGAR